MKKIVKYVCDLCGEAYDCQSDAGLCEASHIIPIELDNRYHPRYNSFSNSPFAKYPIRIRVKMSDGETVTYSFERGPVVRTEDSKNSDNVKSQ